MAIDSRVVLLLLPWGQFWNTLKNSFTLFSAYAAIFSIPRGHMFLQPHELEVSTLATGVEDFGIHELRERSPKPWFTLNTLLFFGRTAIRSALPALYRCQICSGTVAWLSCPDQVFVHRSFCTKAPRSFLLSCFSGSQQDLFSLGCVCTQCFSWPLCPLSARNDLFAVLFLCVLPPSLLLPPGQCVEGEHCASCQVPKCFYEVFMKAPEIAKTSSEIYK